MRGKVGVGVLKTAASTLDSNYTDSLQYKMAVTPTLPDDDRTLQW